MKRKIIYILILCLFLLVGCNNKESNNENNNLNNKETVEENVSLKDPVLEWCQLYNPNGFDTITCVVSNPNNEDIDITYDLVFYKEGKEVSRQEAWANFQISPKHNDIIWGNVNIPSSSEADEVKMENIIVTKAYNKSIDAEIKYVERIEDKDYFSIKSKTKPSINTVWLLLYNDKNNNKKCEQGELVVTSTYTSFEQEDKFSTDIDVSGSEYGIHYNEYEIYYNAY